MAKKKSEKGTIAFMQGNEACVDAAIIAGCSFFGGYPITPSTEIAEGLANKLPLVGGVFMQMEDEIASIASIIGASVGGAKAMTATSGPGFSLMQENLGFAYMTEVPIVIINVMRGGPSTGLPTRLSQSDVMQTRFGTHGDYTAIVYCPSTVQETMDMVIDAFNTAETYHTPVIVLMDEMLGHMREKVYIPDPEEIEIRERVFPEVPPEFFEPFAITPSLVSEFVPFGEGYRYNITGLTHDRSGYPTAVPAETEEKLRKLRMKIEMHRDKIIQSESEFMDDALYAVVAYGTVARAAQSAVRKARDMGIRVGLFRPKTLWPFPRKEIRELTHQVRSILVAELNMGQVIREVDRFNPGNCKVKGLLRYDGNPLTPEQILDKIIELRKR